MSLKTGTDDITRGYEHKKMWQKTDHFHASKNIPVWMLHMLHSFTYKMTLRLCKKGTQKIKCTCLNYSLHTQLSCVQMCTWTVSRTYCGGENGLLGGKGIRIPSAQHWKVMCPRTLYGCFVWIIWFLLLFVLLMLTQ